MSSSSEDETIDERDYLMDPINFTPNTSFFGNQIKHLGKTTGNKGVKKNVISINSECRNKINQITSKLISTRSDFLWAYNGQFRISIRNPYQIIETNSGGSTIPSVIKITINMVSPTYFNKLEYITIGGLPYYDVVYDDELGTPFFYAELDSYSEDNDESWYILRGITPSVDGKYGEQTEPP